MAHSYAGNVLHVDLTHGNLEKEHPDDAFYRKFGGGSAMGVFYILKGMPQGIDALSPGNVLTVFTGVPTGLPVPGQSRITVNARSPLTNAIGDSQAGGFFPAAFRASGFDGLVISGRSPKPVYLFLHDGQAELRDASHLWGKLTDETERLIHAELQDDKLEVMQIGPSGEKLVRFAAIMNMCNRANGRTGMGAVMGSKNLKAIVVKKSMHIEPSKPEIINKLSRLGAQNVETIPDVRGLKINGTGDVVPFQNSAGTLPTRNYSEGQFESFADISGEKVTATILQHNDTCFACSVRCKRVVQTEFKGQKVLPEFGGPEYETLATFGSYCGNKDLASIALANQICDQYGLDTISCGAVIAFAMECFENGILTTKETEGINLRFGNPDAMLAVLEKIARREGIGDILAEGSERASRKFGKNSNQYLITCKGQEAPAHMPQAKKSLGVIYAVNPFGADHQSSEHDPMYEEGGASLYFERLAKLGLTQPQPPSSLTDEKVRYAYLTEVFYSILDSYCLCQFAWGPSWELFGPVELVELIQAATGWDITLQEMMTIGERRLNMMRAFNAREGLTREDDRLPEKFFTPLKGTGPTAGFAWKKGDLEHAKDMYYQYAGWDPQTGNPGRQKMKELGLDWFAS